jgi:hypothetical protein
MTGRAIVWGKWWRVFRLVPLLAISPALVGVGLFQEWYWKGVGGWIAGGVEAALVLAYGAAVTSLGLGLATWVPHRGRAVALTVAVVVLVTAGWSFLGWAAMLFDPYAQYFAAGSPFFGVIDAMNLSWWSGFTWEVAVWAAVYTFAAAALLGATLATSERFLRPMDQRAANTPSSQL